MKKMAFALLLLISICIQTTLSEEKEVVLQNGVDNYSGCEDSYVDSDNPYDIYSRLQDLYTRHIVTVGT